MRESNTTVNNKRHQEALDVVDNWLAASKKNKITDLGGVVENRPAHNIKSPNNPSLRRK